MRKIEDCIQLVLQESSHKRIYKRYTPYLGVSILNSFIHKYKSVPEEVMNAAILIDFYEYTDNRQGYLEKNKCSLRAEYLVCLLRQQPEEDLDDYIRRIIKCHDPWACRLLYYKYYNLYKLYERIGKDDLSEQMRRNSVRLLKHID